MEFGSRASVVRCARCDAKGELGDALAHERLFKVSNVCKTWWYKRKERVGCVTFADSSAQCLWGVVSEAKLLASGPVLSHNL